MREYVLVPFDGSECAERGFEWAIEHYPDATVTVLSVADPLSGTGLSQSDAPLDVGDTRADGEGQEVIEMDRLVRTDTDVQTVVVAGTPAATIIDYAGKREFDAIVMGTHGRSGVIRLLFGSVAETVARHSSAPVTLVK
jgi:nucleotide-binding universal stress UspA family protein